MKNGNLIQKLIRFITNSQQFQVLKNQRKMTKIILILAIKDKFPTCLIASCSFKQAKYESKIYCLLSKIIGYMQYQTIFSLINKIYEQILKKLKIDS